MVKTTKKISYSEYEYDVENKQLYKINDFEGPLDLLLFLIKQKKMDILNINLIEVADQYIEIISNSENLNLDDASESLLIASKLLSLKSKSLLDKTLEEDSIIDSDEENLIDSLIKYERIKTASQEIERIFDEISIMDKIDDDLELFLKQNKNLEEIIFKNDKNELSDALQKVIENVLKDAEVIEVPTVRVRKLSIDEIMMNLIKEFDTKNVVYFSKLIKNKDKIYIAYMFLAVLELTSKKKLLTDIKRGDILITKNEQFT